LALPANQLPSASSVLRRALVLWGAGHLALGDRRGWLLLILQPLAIAAVAVVALQLLDGTRWLVVFAPLLILLVVWLAQAVHAHRRAIALGATPGGEIQIAAFLPLALVVVTAFWLVGGRHGSPAATVEAYMAAWMADRPDVATRLFVEPPLNSELSQTWTQDLSTLTSHMTIERARYGPISGLDPARPFASLRVTDMETGQTGEAQYLVELVRSERYETTVLGVIPTAAQRTVVVRPVLLIDVREQTGPAGWLPSSTWEIYGIGRLEDAVN
jgi:hypothetical protein